MVLVCKYYVDGVCDYSVSCVALWCNHYCIRVWSWCEYNV